MKFILGKKLEMTQIWVGEERKAVTAIAVGPCTVLQVKTKENDGYRAVQLGFAPKSSKNIAKPQLKHMQGGAFRWLREFRLDKPGKWGEISEVKIGDQITIATLVVGDKLRLTGTVKGRGFAGVVKRHGFHGHSATHGTKDQLRMPGSIGAGGVQHVFKGKRMPGRMGGNQVTFKDVLIVAIDETKNVIYVEGGVPGSRGSLVKLFGTGDLIVSTPVSKLETSGVEEIKGEPTQIEINEETEVVIKGESAQGEISISTEDEMDKEAVLETPEAK